MEVTDSVHGAQLGIKKKKKKRDDDIITMLHSRVTYWVRLWQHFGKKRGRSGGKTTSSKKSAAGAQPGGRDSESGGDQAGKTRQN